MGRFEQGEKHNSSQLRPVQTDEFRILRSN